LSAWQDDWLGVELTYVFLQPVPVLVKDAVKGRGHKYFRGCFCSCAARQMPWGVSQLKKRHRTGHEAPFAGVIVRTFGRRLRIDNEPSPPIPLVASSTIEVLELHSSSS
jgi:hypothetical protein